MAQTEMVEEATTEDSRTETDKADDSIETTGATEATTVTVATGIVQSVKIQTSHSVPNATDAAHLVAAAVAVAVDPAGTPETDRNEATLEGDRHEEKAKDLQEGTAVTDEMNVGIKTVVHTIKIVHEVTSVNRNANRESHAHFANPEETAPAMPTTDLRNH